MAEGLVFNMGIYILLTEWPFDEKSNHRNILTEPAKVLSGFCGNL
jgi:hypothetical protein